MAKQGEKETLSASDVGTVAVGAGGELITDFDKALLDAIKDWADEQIGFPPYWNPMGSLKTREEAIGRKLLFKPVALDERDPEFPRYICQASRVPIMCQSGPADDAKPVLVKVGENFTLSPYAALPLDRYFDIEVYIEITGTRKLVGNEASNNRPRDLWEWKLKVSPQDQKMLNARRADETKRLMEARRVQLLNAPASA